MANDLTAVKQLVAFIFKAKNQLTGYLEDGNITFFESIGIASFAVQTVPMVKGSLPEIKKIKKLSVAEISEIVDHVINEFSLPKNKALEAQIKLSVKWLQSTCALIEGWKNIK